MTFLPSTLFLFRTYFDLGFGHRIQTKPHTVQVKENKTGGGKGGGTDGGVGAKKTRSISGQALPVSIIESSQLGERVVPTSVLAASVVEVPASSKRHTRSIAQGVCELLSGWGEVAEATLIGEGEEGGGRSWVGTDKATPVRAPLKTALSLKLEGAKDVGGEGGREGGIKRPFVPPQKKAVAEKDTATTATKITEATPSIGNKQKKQKQKQQKETKKEQKLKHKEPAKS